MKSSNNSVDDDNVLTMGKIVGVHGIRGVVKVLSYAESTVPIEEAETIFIKRFDGVFERRRVLWMKPHKQGFLMALEGVGDRDTAAALAGSFLLMERDRLPELEEGTYYWADLIGLSVYGMKGDFLGWIDSVIPTGGNDVYVVKEGEREVLIPALESVIVGVDLEAKIMTVDLPEGL